MLHFCFFSFDWQSFCFRFWFVSSFSCFSSPRLSIGLVCVPLGPGAVGTSFGWTEKGFPHYREHLLAPRGGDGFGFQTGRNKGWLIRPAPGNGLTCRRAADDGYTPIPTQSPCHPEKVAGTLCKNHAPRGGSEG